VVTDSFTVLGRRIVALEQDDFFENVRVLLHPDVMVWTTSTHPGSLMCRR
jgi:hypothetical protein